MKPWNSGYVCISPKIHFYNLLASHWLLLHLRWNFGRIVKRERKKNGKENERIENFIVSTICFHLCSAFSLLLSIFFSSFVHFELRFVHPDIGSFNDRTFAQCSTCFIVYTIYWLKSFYVCVRVCVILSALGRERGVAAQVLRNLIVCQLGKPQWQTKTMWLLNYSHELLFIKFSNGRETGGRSSGRCWNSSKYYYFFLLFSNTISFQLWVLRHSSVTNRITTMTMDKPFAEWRQPSGYPFGHN